MIAVGGCYAEAQRERIFELYPDVDVAFGPGLDRPSRRLARRRRDRRRPRPLRPRRPRLRGDAPAAPRAPLPGLGAGLDGLQLGLLVLHRPGRPRPRAEPPPGRHPRRGHAARRRGRQGGHAARPERQLVGPRPRARHPHRVRRAAARVRRGRGHRAHPLHEPAPEGLPRAGDRRDRRVRRGLRARAPAAAVGLVARSSRRCAAPTRASATSSSSPACAPRSPTSPSARTSSSASRARPRTTSAQTLEVVEEVGFDSAFTFVYSPRHGTEAAAMPDQVPHETKIERMERLVEVDAADRARAQRGARRPRRGGARRGPVAHRRVAAARPHAPEHDGELHRHARAGRARPGRIEARDVDDAARPPERSPAARLAGLADARPPHRLVGPDRHEPRAAAAAGRPLGLRRRQARRTPGRTSSTRCSRTSPATTRRSTAASAASSTREVDVVVHMAAHAKVHQLVRQPHRALENAMMTFNVLEYCRQLELPLVFSSTREVYGDVHRFEEYGEAAADFAYTESPYSGVEDHLRGVHLLVRPLLRPAVPRLPLLERLRPLRQRPAADGARAAAVHPPDEPRRADHGLRRRREGARLHLHRRLRRRHRARHRAPRRRPRRRTRRSTSPTARATRSCARRS